MTTTDKWIDIIYSAIDEINTMREDQPDIEKSPATVLYGKSGQLDSLGLVTLIVSVEGKVQDESGTTVAITDERALTRPVSPFQSVESLASYIDELVQEETGG